MMAAPLGGCAEVSLSGPGVYDWLRFHGLASSQSVGPLRWGALAFISAGLDSFAPSGAHLNLSVLGPAEPANSLEMAQVIIEQIAALPDARLLADASIDLRIVHR